MTDKYAYRRLELDEIHNLFQNSALFHKERVLTYLNQLNFSKHLIKDEKIINILTKISIFSSIYNFDIEKLLNSISNFQSFNQINLYFKSIKQELTQKKLIEQIILQTGHIKRILYGTPKSSLFQQNRRIYIKIPNIPSFFAQLQQIVNQLNTNIPTEQHLQLKIIDSERQKKIALIRDGKKEIKIGRFLVSFIKQLEEGKQIIQQLSHQEFDTFTKMLMTHSIEQVESINKFLKSKTGKSLLFSTPLFFEFKKISSLKKNELLSHLSSIQSFYITQQKSIHNTQIKETDSLSFDENTPDMIILSSRPRDIARISEYTDWNSCMAQNDEYSYDLPVQIGVGSIVAYLVNSKNPYKRLGRILLKPFIPITAQKQIEERLNSFYQSNCKKYLNLFEKTALISPSDSQKYYLPLIKKLKKFDSNLHMESSDHNRIYLADKAYGKMKSLFSSHLKKIVKKYINTQKNYGLFKTVSNYYVDSLQNNYYFPDPNNPENIQDFLKSKQTHFHIFSRNNQTYLSTISLYIPNIRHLNLSGCIAKYVKIHALDLVNLDERGLYVNDLTIVNAEHLSVIPPTVKIQNSLKLESDKMLTLPCNIHCDKLTVECKNLTHIPSDIHVNQLVLINSVVEKLPPLNLDLLDMRYSKIKDISQLTVSNYLDLSNTPLECLPSKMHLEHLFLRQCTRLKKLPSDLKVKWIDIGKTNISNLPAQHYECILMISNTGVKKFQTGLTFNVLEAQYSSLESLPENLKSQKINITKTNIQTLPSKLSVETLIINDTNIQELPPDLKAKEVHAKQTKITEIPANIQINVLHLTNTPVKVIHYTEKVHAFYLNHIPQYIHPNISPFNFIGISEKDVKLAQERYQKRYLESTKIAHHPNLNTLPSTGQFRTIE